MTLRARPRSFRFPSRPLSLRASRAQPEQRGYALLILMMVVTVLLIALTAALPSVYFEGQREREEELIFRGNEYARAIAFFHRRFNRYPTSVQELIQTNGIRFLRRAYPDPMSKDGKWRFIHTAPNGAVLDSRTLSPGVAGRTLPRGEEDSQAATGQGERTPGVGGGLARGNSSSRFRTDFDSAQSQSRPSGSSGNSSEAKGSFIMGVASTSDKESIRILKGKTHYDEWEFLGNDPNLVIQPVPGRPPGASPNLQPPKGRPPGAPPNLRGFSSPASPGPQPARS